MAKGDKIKKDMLEDMRSAKEALGDDATADDLMAWIEKEMVKEGVVKPSIENDPGAMEALTLLVEWCGNNNRRITVTSEGGKIGIVRKKKVVETPAV